MTRNIAVPAALSALAAAVYFGLMSGDLGFVVNTVLKGAAVAILAVAAALTARNLDGWLLAAALAFGAAGDMLLEVELAWGGTAFALGHIAAIALYLRNRRPRGAMPVSQKAASAAIWLSAPVVYLLAGQDANIGLALYTLLLTTMAATAWISRFSRYRTGIGAVLFVASDAFIFARLGGRVDPALATQLIWPLYAAGQILIFIGVRVGLNRQG